MACSLSPFLSPVLNNFATIFMLAHHTNLNQSIEDKEKPPKTHTFFKRAAGRVRVGTP